MKKPTTAALAAVLLAGCASAPGSKPASDAKPDLGFAADPYPGTYQRIAVRRCCCSTRPC